jgi:putative phosphoesterase
VGGAQVLEALRAVAPLTAVRGNNDRGPWAEALPHTAVVELEGASIYLLHDRAELDLDPRAAGMAAVVCGHSHKPLQEERDGVLHFNPGSAGPRRFQLPITVGRFHIQDGLIRAAIIALE